MSYEGTIQEKAMELMGEKLLAAEALEGKFSSEGIVAMADDDGIELAMAKSLAENMEQSTDRSWQAGISSRASSKPMAVVDQSRDRTAAVIE